MSPHPSSPYRVALALDHACPASLGRVVSGQLRRCRGPEEAELGPCTPGLGSWSCPQTAQHPPESLVQSHAREDKELEVLSSHKFAEVIAVGRAEGQVESQGGVSGGQVRVYPETWGIRERGCGGAAHRCTSLPRSSTPAQCLYFLPRCRATSAFLKPSSR